MQTAQPETAPLWSNDLVTTQYLDVPSSGYARTADAKWSAGHAANCTLSGLSTVSPAAEHAQSGANKENKTGAISDQDCLISQWLA